VCGDLDPALSPAAAETVTIRLEYVEWHLDICCAEFLQVVSKSKVATNRPEYTE
jgi:hypothetical protein